jgi:hypothetical protein
VLNLYASATPQPANERGTDIPTSEAFYDSVHLIAGSCRLKASFGMFHNRWGVDFWLSGLSDLDEPHFQRFSVRLNHLVSFRARASISAPPAN